MEEPEKIQMQYAGTIGLLAELHLTCSDKEQKELIRIAIDDWCKVSGWTYKQIIDRIELIPPQQ